MRNLFRNPLFSFLLKAFFLFIAWLLIYEFWLHPKKFADIFLIENLRLLTSGFLEIIGYDMIQYPKQTGGTMRAIGIDGSHGLWIGDNCNGLSLFALFTGFIISFPGPWKTKLIFIPAGILIIHLLNVFRIAALCIIMLHAPEYMDFNHTYTFTLIVYSCVFALWIFWVNKFSMIKIKDEIR
jgi:exosortase family protein XrtF